MKKIAYISVSFLLGLFFISCIGEEVVVPPEAQSLEIAFGVDHFRTAAVAKATRATDPGTAEEQQVDNVFVFLFDESGANPIKYFITATPSAGGTLVVADNKVTVNMSPSDAGKRLVHLVANCADLQTALNGVTTVAGLEAIIRTTAQPWSPNIATPLLMYGAATASHDFAANNILNSVPLTRAVAKLELDITLTPQRQSKPLVGGNAQYRYQLINFDTQTYLIKPDTKPADTASFTDWADWDAAGTVTSYTLAENGKVTALKLVTYLNESDEADAAGTALKLIIPFVGGMLPPPQFGEEPYSLELPLTIERNRWYKYDIEI